MGYDNYRFVGLSEGFSKPLMCSICLNIFKNAIRTDCEHTFCRECLQNWIWTHHKECPECRTNFSRKRSNDSKNVLINNFVFKSHLIVNSLINELTIKCDYESNGCEEVMKLSQLTSHVKDCPHRLCKTCGLTKQRNNDHNCIELLKNDRNCLQNKSKELNEQNLRLILELKLSDAKQKQLSEEVKRLGDELSESNAKIVKLEEEVHKKDCLLESLNKTTQLSFKTENILFGTFIISCQEIRLNVNSIDLIGLSIKKSGPKSRTRSLEIAVNLSEVQEILYCNSIETHLLFIKPDLNLCRKIQKSLYLENKSMDDRVFDFKSNGNQCLNT